MTLILSDDTPGKNDGAALRDQEEPTLRERVRFQRVRLARQFIRKSRPLDITWRIVILLVGVLILAAGIAMLALPGPGWAVIFIGLAVLATEFDWAQRILESARQKARAAKERAKNPKARRGMIIVTVVVLVIAVAAGLWYLNEYGMAGPDWLPDWARR